MTEAVALTIGSAVHGDEGFLGEIEDLVVDPAEQVVTRVTIRPRHEGGEARLVPAAMLEAGPDGLRLNCTFAQFEELPAASGRSGG